MKCVLRARTDSDTSNPLRIDEGQGLEKFHRRCDVADFSRRDLGLSGLAPAFTEAGEVEHERRVPSLRQTPSVRSRHLFFDGQPRADRDDGRLTSTDGVGVPEEASHQRNALAVEDYGQFEHWMSSSMFRPMDWIVGGGPQRT